MQGLTVLFCNFFNLNFVSVLASFRNLMAKQKITELGFTEADDKVKAGVTHVETEVYEKGHGEPVAGIKN